MADKKQAAAKKDKGEQLQLPTGIKIETINKDDLAKVKERHSKLSPVSDTATAMSQKMLGDGLPGQVIALSNPALQAGKESIRRLLKRDLDRIAHRAKLRYSTRVVEEGQSLIFYYESKRVVEKKKDKQQLTVQPTA
jgi:hypothetical protein